MRIENNVNHMSLNIPKVENKGVNKMVSEVKQKHETVQETSASSKQGKNDVHVIREVMAYSETKLGELTKTYGKDGKTKEVGIETASKIDVFV